VANKSWVYFCLKSGSFFFRISITKPYTSFSFFHVLTASLVISFLKASVKASIFFNPASSNFVVMTYEDFDLEGRFFFLVLVGTVVPVFVVVVVHVEVFVVVVVVVVFVVVVDVEEELELLPPPPPPHPELTGCDFVLTMNVLETVPIVSVAATDVE
jgi:hypothetical protein